MLHEVSQINPRANKVKPQEMVDTRYVDEMERILLSRLRLLGRRCCLAPAGREANRLAARRLLFLGNEFPNVVRASKGNKVEFGGVACLVSRG